jgi:phosphoserine/homoserine phosphotransferase
VIVATDLEGVFLPEIWAEIARVTGRADLSVSSHEEPDFGKLMERRIEILTEADIRLPELIGIAANVLPYPGAVETLAWLRTKGQVLIISDTFHELSEGIVQRMGGYNLFANTFRTDDAGRILGHRLRIRGRKDRVIRSLKEIGFTIVAIGDGWNDEQMFRTADHPVLYNVPEALAAAFPSARRAGSFEELRRHVIEIEETVTGDRSRTVH